ncbi:MAG: hypothetical protein H0W78_05140 [Planctomycetes bacterium]|nr:hypothetical protein [Planctomycetota bacterium]
MSADHTLAIDGSDLAPGDLAPGNGGFMADSWGQVFLVPSHHHAFMLSLLE